MENFSVDYQQLPCTQISVAAVNSTTQSFTFNTVSGYQTPADFKTNRPADGSDAIWMFIFRNGPVPAGASGISAVANAGW